MLSVPFTQCSFAALLVYVFVCICIFIFDPVSLKNGNQRPVSVVVSDWDVSYNFDTNFWLFQQSDAVFFLDVQSVVGFPGEPGQSFSYEEENVFHVKK